MHEAGVPPKRYLQVVEYWTYSRVEKIETYTVSDSQVCCHGKTARCYERHKSWSKLVSPWDVILGNLLHFHENLEMSRISLEHLGLLPSP